MTKTLAALAAVVLAGILAIGHVTDGFRVFTTEDARRLSVREQPRPLPPTLVQYETGAPLPLAESLRDDGRVAIVVFFYTRCTTICSVLGSEFQQLQQTLQARGLERKVRLLSISFDSGDVQPELAAYAGRMRARAADWRVAQVVDAGQRERLLRTFGITVIPAPLGQFQHNAAFHILTPDGKLVRIIDYDRPQQALDQALSLADRLAQQRASAPAPGAAS